MENAHVVAGRKAVPLILIWKAERMRRYAENPKICKNCRSVIKYEKRRTNFCNQSCAATYNNHKRSPDKQLRYCECGKQLPYNHKITCSIPCLKERHYKNYISNWLSEKIAGGTWRGVSSLVRRWLIENRGEKCEKCGWAERNPVTGKIPVQVNHKDGNPNRHTPDNLELICPNCHSLTSTYCGLNKGNGRKERLSEVIRLVA